MADDATPLAQPRRLAELIDYQDGSVVSRTLVKRTGGTVTLFAFDAGQSLSEHTAPFDALVQVLDGVGECVVDGTPHRLEAGEVLLLPAHRPHAVNAPQPFKMLLTMIKSPGEEK